jgi:hypothetical protein
VPSRPASVIASPPALPVLRRLAQANAEREEWSL